MSSGPARASGRSNGFADERSRVPGANGAFRGERQDARRSTSPQVDGGASHKRTTSGQPRALSRATEERRYEERRVTERTFEAHVERHLSRATSPEKSQRRGPPVEKRPAEVRRQKSTELRPREQRAETPTGMISHGWNLAVDLRVELCFDETARADARRSTMEP